MSFWCKKVWESCARALGSVVVEGETGTVLSRGSAAGVSIDMRG